MEFKTFYSDTLGAGVPSLTVTVDIYKDTVKLVTNANAVEIGGGLYKYSFDSDDVGDYIAIFKTSSNGVRSKHNPSALSIEKNSLLSVTGNITILADGNNYITFGSVNTILLEEDNIYQPSVPIRAKAVAIQALGGDIVMTTDNSTPTVEHGFRLLQIEGRKIHQLDNTRRDILKFLPLNSSTKLVYQFLK